MHESKRKRLEAKGWKVGSAAEFLNLSPDEESYIELRLRLADGLKRRRKQHKLTQTQLAKALRSSQSRVARMEAGDPSVMLDLLIRGLLKLGVQPGGVARIISGARLAPGTRKPHAISAR